MVVNLKTALYGMLVGALVCLSMALFLAHAFGEDIICTREVVISEDFNNVFRATISDMAKEMHERGCKKGMVVVEGQGNKVKITMTCTELANPA